MKKITLIFLFLSAAQFQNLYSQLSLNPDSLKTGKSYKFILYDDAEVIGRINSQDSVYYYVTGKEGSYRLRKDDIFLVSGNLINNNYKTILSLGGGISFLATNHNGNFSEDFKSIISAQFSLLFPLGESKGIRVDAGYSKWKRGEFKYSYSPNDYNIYGAQTKDYYYAKGDFVFGIIAPVNKFWIYGTAGLGIHYVTESPYTYTYSYYSSFDSTNHVSTNNNPEQNYVSATLSIGGALGYRFTDRLGVYADIQLNTVTREGFFLFFWGGEGGYIPVRAGITYIIY